MVWSYPQHSLLSWGRPYRRTPVSNCFDFDLSVFFFFIIVMIFLAVFPSCWAGYFHLLAQMKVTKAKGTPSQSSATPIPCATRKTNGRCATHKKRYSIVFCSDSARYCVPLFFSVARRLPRGIGCFVEGVVCDSRLLSGALLGLAIPKVLLLVAGHIWTLY